MQPRIYNVPVSALASHDASAVTIRSRSAATLARALTGDVLPRVVSVQLLGLEADPAPLAVLDAPVPVDVVLDAPATQFADLYALAALRERHPVRVTVRAAPGFSKAVRLAAALDLPVKIDVGQPDEALVDELLDVLDLYLHAPTVSRPIEFFHSVFVAIFHETRDSLWEIQEDDPATYRYVPDEAETPRGRQTAGAGDGDPDTFVERRFGELVAEERECGTCGYAPACRGYFKYPDREYDCAGVRKVFGVLEAAACSIAEDLASGPKP